MGIKSLLFFPILVFPAFIGTLFVKQTKENQISIAESYFCGQFCLWSLFQILAIISVQIKWSFTLLYYLFLLFSITLSVCGIIHKNRHKTLFRIKFAFPKTIIMKLILIITVGLIMYQISMYIIGVHLDEDDARWLAEANDAKVSDTMFLSNPSTGEYIGGFIGDMKRDSFSPWPMYFAFLSRLTGIRVAVIAHTIYAPFLLLFSYLVYLRIGKGIFERQEERIIFLLMVSVIMLFFGGQKRSEAVVALIRIWQGKAAVAAIGIPAVLSQILVIQKEDVPRNWLILAMITLANCLFSGMGIVLSIISVGGYGLYVVINKRWRRIPYLLIAVLPAVILELAYQLN